MEKKFKIKIYILLVLAIMLSNINVLALSTSKWKTTQNKMYNTTDGIIATDVEVINFTDETGVNRKEYTITYTIPEDFDDDVIRIVPTGYINDCAMPGDDDRFVIKIENKSENTYHYIDNSFVLSTEDFSIYTDDEIGIQVADAYSFTDTPIREKISFYRTKNTAIQSLYGVTSTSKVTADMLKDSEIDKVLDKEKYPNGSKDLNKYYLDFYNQKYETNATKLEDLPDQAIAEMFNGNYTKSYAETNKEVIELAYNFLYNKLFAFTFDKSKINDENSQNYSVGSYMRKENSYSIANNLLKENLSNIESNITSSIIMPHVYLNGRYMTNIYQNYYIGFYIELSLEKEKKIDQEEPVIETPDKEEPEEEDPIVEVPDDDETKEDLEEEYPLPPKTNYEG